MVWKLNGFSDICSDDHGFSPLHWLAKEGHTKLVEMLLQRGARVNATNMGDDIPLHLAVAHGHLDIVLLVSHSIPFSDVLYACRLKNISFIIRSENIYQLLFAT